VEAFRAAQYDEAIDSFKQAVALEPKSVPALLHLAEAYLASPMETDKVKAGRDTLLRVLEIDVKNLKAVSNLAALSFAQVGGEGADLDDARKWQVRLLELSPENKEAHYAMGAIAWTRFYPAWQAARKSARLKPEDPGPFKDAKLRTALKAEWGATLQEGMDHLQRAIELDPTYADALTRLSVLIRERADLADNLYAWLAEVKKADALLKRAGR
jgi:tetratricopeptide (TPR) repeat protein